MSHHEIAVRFFRSRECWDLATPQPLLADDFVAPGLALRSGDGKIVP